MSNPDSTNYAEIAYLLAHITTMMILWVFIHLVSRLLELLE